MALDNRNTRPLRKRLYIPAASFNGYSLDIKLGASAGTNAVSETSGVLKTAGGSAQEVVGSTAATDQNARLRSIGTGTPRLVDINALKTTGLLCTAATDAVEFCQAIPSDLDRTRTVGVRLAWTSEEATTSRNMTWRARFTKFTLGAAAGASTAGVLSAGATALNTTIALQATGTTAKTILRTSRGIINANTFLSLDYFWSWLIDLQTVSGGTTNQYILGMELDYVPRIFTGRRAAQDALTDEIL